LEEQKQGEGVQRSTVNDLWSAIDRLIERCCVLGRDRASLAKMLARAQEELVQERSVRARAEERCREMQVCLEEAVLRLEKLAEAAAKTGGLPQVLPQPQPREERAEAGTQDQEKEKKHDPLAHVVAKTWDHRNLERIVRPQNAQSVPAPLVASAEQGVLVPLVASATPAASVASASENEEQDLFSTAESGRLF